jgi:hypothetical protein
MRLPNQVGKEFDYVFVDVLPERLVSIPVIVRRQSGGVLLVLDAQNMRRGLLGRAWGG